MSVHVKEKNPSRKKTVSKGLRPLETSEKESFVFQNSLGKNRAGLSLRINDKNCDEGWHPPPIEPYNSEAMFSKCPQRKIVINGKIIKTDQERLKIKWDPGLPHHLPIKGYSVP